MATRKKTAKKAAKRAPKRAAKKRTTKRTTKRTSKKAATKSRMVCPKTKSGRKVKKLSNGACMVKTKSGRALFVKKVRATRSRSR